MMYLEKIRLGLEEEKELGMQTAFTTGYRRKDKRSERSDRKARKKT
jgi:hypothetical protein